MARLILIFCFLAVASCHLPTEPENDRGQVLDTSVGRIILKNEAPPSEEVAALQHGIDRAVDVAVQQLKRPRAAFGHTLDGWSFLITPKGSFIYMGGQYIEVSNATLDAIEQGARQEVVTALAFVLRTCQAYEHVDECESPGGVDMNCNPC